MKTNIVVKRKLLSYFKCTPYFVCIYVIKKLLFVKGQIMTHHYGLVFIRFSSFLVLKSNQHFIKHNMLLLLCLDEIISRNNIQITTTPWLIPKYLCFLNNILHRYGYKLRKLHINDVICTVFEWILIAIKIDLIYLTYPITN